MDTTKLINQLEFQISILEEEIENKSDELIVNNYQRKLRNLKTALSINIQQLEYLECIEYKNNMKGEKLKS